jgi:hypothetical protein
MLHQFRIDLQPKSTLPYPLHRSPLLRFIEAIIARQVAKAQRNAAASPPSGLGERGGISRRPIDPVSIRPGLTFLGE